MQYQCIQADFDYLRSVSSAGSDVAMLSFFHSEYLKQDFNLLRLLRHISYFKTSELDMD